jgi:hypothetical protein
MPLGETGQGFVPTARAYESLKIIVESGREENN